MLIVEKLVWESAVVKVECEDKDGANPGANADKALDMVAKQLASAALAVVTQTLAPLIQTSADRGPASKAPEDCDSDESEGSSSEEEDNATSLQDPPTSEITLSTGADASKKYPRRRGQHLRALKTGLRLWRNTVYEMEFSDGIHLQTVIMPDKVLSMLASAKNVTELSDFARLKLKWPLKKVYGEEVIRVLANIEASEVGRKAGEKELKRLRKSSGKAIQSRNKENTTIQAPTTQARKKPHLAGLPSTLANTKHQPLQPISNRPLQPLSNLAPEPTTPTPLYARLFLTLALGLDSISITFDTFVHLNKQLVFGITEKGSVVTILPCRQPLIPASSCITTLHICISHQALCIYLILSMSVFSLLTPPVFS
ncbi:hypothetical protein FRC00_006706 [Tulasnella sp. 408]|nr:hypothetical protein FRC00_006706 [Tulasnella sp. 408]